MLPFNVGTVLQVTLKVFLKPRRDNIEGDRKLEDWEIGESVNSENMEIRKTGKSENMEIGEFGKLRSWVNWGLAKIRKS